MALSAGEKDAHHPSYSQAAQFITWESLLWRLFLGDCQIQSLVVTTLLIVLSLTSYCMCALY